MNGLKFRHTLTNGQNFLFSSKESNEEYYGVAYELTKKLFIGIAKRAMVFNCPKYNFYEPPFVFRERQLDSLIMPELAFLCKGLAIAEYPVTRNSRKKGFEIKNSKGRTDYWCIYKDYSFVIEVKHSYDNFETKSTNKTVVERWKKADRQLIEVKDNIRQFAENTKGVIRLGLHFIISCSRINPSESVSEDYVSKEKDKLHRLYEELRPAPNFMSIWELNKDKIYYDDRAYPGVILAAKFFKDIKHGGLKY